MDKSVVYQKMRELEVKIHYHFNDIAWLSKAMKSEKIEVSGEGKNHSEYTNDGLATIGDTVLKSVIADYLYRKGILVTLLQQIIFCNSVAESET